MKNTLCRFLLVSIFISGNAFAVNLQSFHNRNFQPMGNFCGLHIEVSGQSIVASNIIPPNVAPEDAKCGWEGWWRCHNSYLLQCDSKGHCATTGPDQLELTLLQDGNIFNHTNGIKILRSTRMDYQWCNQ